MGMLDRYKKKGGFIQLLNLIETSGKVKQEQFLKLIADENPVWEETIRKKILTFEKILGWGPETLSEVLTRVQPLTLATALSGMPKERVETILNCTSMSERRKIMQAIDEARPTPAEISTCIMKLITETRGFIQGGILKMDKIDPELAIPENIEEQLASNAIGRSLGSFGASSSPASEANPAELNFDGPKKHAEASPEIRGDHREEVEFLKRKVNQLASENTSLKQEISSLRGKLDQIKRIA